MPVPADMLVTLIGEQAVEIRVLRAENGQLRKMVGEMQKKYEGCWLKDEGGAADAPGSPDYASPIRPTRADGSPGMGS